MLNLVFAHGIVFYAHFFLYYGKNIRESQSIWLKKNCFAKKKGKAVVESIGCDGCSQNGNCPFAGEADKCDKIEATKEIAETKEETETSENSEEIKDDEKVEADATPSAEDGKEEDVNG